MRILGTMVTTIIEGVDVELPDDLPNSEVAELFMKICMTLAQEKIFISKDTKFCPLSRIVEKETAEEGKAT